MSDPRHYLDLSDLLREVQKSFNLSTARAMAAKLDIHESILARTKKGNAGPGTQLRVARNLRDLLTKAGQTQHDQWLTHFEQWCMDRINSKTNQEWADRWLHVHTILPTEEIQGSALLTTGRGSSALQGPPGLNQPLPPTGRFFGYRTEMARALRGMKSYQSLVWIDGLEGTGKTTFLRQLIGALSEPTRNAKVQFQNIIWISAEDRQSEVPWLDEVLDAIARRLEWSYLAKTRLTPEQYQEKKNEVLNVLEHTATLIVIDNYHLIHEPELDHWLSLVQGRSVVLISSRPLQDVNTRPKNAWLVRLKGLEGKAGRDFLRYHAERIDLHRPELADDEAIDDIVKQMAGHPLSLHHLLTEAKLGGLSLWEAVEFVRSQGINWERQWQELNPEAKRVLMVMTFFGETASRAALSATAGLTSLLLHEAIKQLVYVHLLNVQEMSGAGLLPYALHARVRSFAEDKLREEQTFAASARGRWATYYIQLASSNSRRGPEEQRYWASLGNFTVEPIGSEWTNLERVLAWASMTADDRVLVELTMMLVHYMDKLALFRQRLIYARRAADAAHRLGQYEEEAWLRIDGLGWTLIEEGDLHEAETEIEKGKEIAKLLYGGTRSLDGKSPKQQTANNILALAHAFLARVYLKAGSTEKARLCLQQRPDHTYWPIIQSRINDVGGEIAFAEGNYLEAIKLFNKANATIQSIEIGGSHLLGEAYRKDGDYVNARKAYYQVIEAYQPAVTIEVIQAYLGLARTAQAQKQAQQGQDGNEDPCVWAQRAQKELRRLYPKHPLMATIQAFLTQHCSSSQSLIRKNLRKQ